MTSTTIKRERALEAPRVPLPNFRSRLSASPDAGAGSPIQAIVGAAGWERQETAQAIAQPPSIHRCRSCGNELRLRLQSSHVAGRYILMPIALVSGGLGLLGSNGILIGCAALLNGAAARRPPKKVDVLRALGHARRL